MKRIFLVAALSAYFLCDCTRYEQQKSVDSFTVSIEQKVEQKSEPESKPALEETVQQEVKPTVEKAVEQKAVTSVERKSESTLKIASFNIQAFGKSKRGKKPVVDVLARVVRNFDITAVQEFRDNTETTLPFFVAKINEFAGDKYDSVSSERLGRTDSKENYAYIFNKRTITFSGKSYTYADKKDDFEREPFVATFSSNYGNFTFTLVNIHTKPDDAKKEIQTLVDVINDADKKLKDKDIIVLGDYNSDGSYFSESTTNGFRDASTYTWVIGDDLDTTTKSTVCTYDRIVFRTKYTKTDFAGKSGVFDFKTEYKLTQPQTEAVSDHFPVWAVFYTNKDSD